ncbi:hypothetical protein FRZ67_04285 [Panacibacter ginsenosidivorans]|uniref:Uncharacterized protein n=1 Tax=Panacibacter ginsenosidivorans TaxID=1813871 RepID=A0A5B8V704_9BACT|nr:hypothetical protein [Panacibacter ginsenosidivorans]QEC66551.1 hypothetical protein FRZ67_04285 [Panacibacter ginsenosidivorans]
MKKFIIKYKGTILFYSILIIAFWFFKPYQNKFYLDADINAFKSKYYISMLLVVGLSLLIVFFVIAFLKLKNIKDSLILTLYSLFYIATLLFFGQDLILATVLFINRQFDKEQITKDYIVTSLAGNPIERNNFFLFDLESKRINSENKLIDKVYNAKLNTKDTINVKFEKGLFGINYLSGNMVVNK